MNQSTAATSALLLDAQGRVYGIDIAIYIDLEELKEKRLSGIYDPVFDELSRVSQQLIDLGFLESTTTDPGQVI